MLFDVVLRYIMQTFQSTLRSITFKYIMNYDTKLFSIKSCFVFFFKLNNAYPRSLPRCILQFQKIKLKCFLSLEIRGFFRAVFL